MCPDIFISTLLKVFESIFGIFRIKDEFSFSLRTLQCILTYLIKGETSQEEEIISQTDDGIYTHKSKYLSLLAYTLFPSFLPFLHIQIHLLLSLSHTHTHTYTHYLSHTHALIISVPPIPHLLRILLRIFPLSHSLSPMTFDIPPLRKNFFLTVTHSTLFREISRTQTHTHIHILSLSLYLLTSRSHIFLL
jgi:hypothetical protein